MCWLNICEISTLKAQEIKFELLSDPFAWGFGAKKEHLETFKIELIKLKKISHRSSLTDAQQPLNDQIFSFCHRPCKHTNYQGHGGAARNGFSEVTATHWCCTLKLCWTFFLKALQHVGNKAWRLKWRQQRRTKGACVKTWFWWFIANEMNVGALGRSQSVWWYETQNTHLTQLHICRMYVSPVNPIVFSYLEEVGKNNIDHFWMFFNMCLGDCLDLRPLKCEYRQKKTCKL